MWLLRHRDVTVSSLRLDTQQNTTAHTRHAHRKHACWKGEVIRVWWGKMYCFVIREMEKMLVIFNREIPDRIKLVIISGVYCTVNKWGLTTYHTSKSCIQLLYSCHFATPQLISWLFQRAVQTLKRLSVSSSLHWNNILSFGFWVFGGWCHKWGSFRPFWLRLLYPKIQGGSISLT